ncbi:MAG: hypothetical protein D6733_05305 [Methanobacteriota archaeon]|nr:MAG: hypothetical protein D6733_05305 [Euryarchaeota archaeon]
MARRRKISLKRRVRKNRSKNKGHVPGRLMLDMGRSSSFRYRLRAILEDVEGSEPIFANINSKSANVGTASAKTYVEEMVTAGALKREKADEIIELLERFSKYR